MISSPTIAVTLNLDDPTPDNVDITIQGRTDASALLCNVPVNQVIPRIRLLYSLCKDAHCIAFLSALECALGIKNAPDIVALRQQLVQLEAFRELSWKFFVDLPNAMALPAKTQWYKTIQSATTEALAELQQLVLSANPLDAEMASTKAQEITTKLNLCIHDLSQFIHQSGWLDELSQVLNQYDWPADAESNTYFVLAAQWEQIKHHYLSLMLRSQDSPIGHLFAEPTRFHPHCAVSEVYCARGILSYSLCLNNARDQVSSLTILPPTLQRFTHDQGIKKQLVSIPNDAHATRRAAVYLALLNPCYPFSVMAKPLQDARGSAHA